MNWRGDQGSSKDRGPSGHIGTSPPRPDGVPKGSGALQYADDFVLPGMYWGATLRSPHPYARIKALRWNPERAPEGAVCVTAADLPGPNGVKLKTDDWPILADSETQHIGEAIALVAAPTKLAARAALEAIDVEYEPLTPVLDLTEADNHPPLCSIDMESGDVEKGFDDSEQVVEGTFRTGYQEHIYIECHAMTSWFEEDGTVVVKGTMQCPYFVHTSMAYGLDLPTEKVRIVATPPGGGFGGKEDYPSMIGLHAALLSKACGHPVRIVYDRHEDIVSTTKRHPSVVRRRAGIDHEGRLQALDIEVILDGGAYTTLSEVVLSRAVLHAAGPYRCPNVRVRGRVLKTNTATNGAFRGFGAPQVAFGHERQMDEIARLIGVDPLEIRLRNVLDEGDRLPTGQVLDESTAARLCLETAAGETDFRRRWRELEDKRANATDGEVLRGIGLSLFFHGAGFTGNGERFLNSKVTVRLLEDGRVEALSAAVEMGQGCAVLFPMLACEASGLAVDDVVISEADTAEVPDSGPRVASRTSMIVGSLLATTVRELTGTILTWWSQRQRPEAHPEMDEGVVTLGVETTPFRTIAKEYFASEGPLEVSHHHQPPEWQVFDDATYQGVAYPTYGWGADVVEVEVDPDTLEVRPLKATAVCEVGKVLHPTLCRGQVEGGTLQALGWALMEEVKLDKGRYLNDRLATYIIPTFKDSPHIEVRLLEQPWSGGLVGAKGVGELPMDGAAPAAASAVESATGLRIDTIPATPERLFEWRQAGQDTSGSRAGGARQDEGGQ
jgi:CO/xanthine dehydrogenase Mo-binding subunit